LLSQVRPSASNETQRDSLLNHITQIYNPDSLNRPTRVELQHNGAPFAVETYDYYPIGRLHTVTRGNRQDQYTYYLDGELQSVTYDAIAAGAPNPGEIPPAQDPAKAKTVEDLLTFPDGMNPNGLQTNAHTVTYALDDAGNRASVSDSLSGTTAYTPNNLNQYTGSVGGNPIINGAEHEIANYQGISYTYMKDEHMIRVSSGNTTCELVYDGLGRCIKRTVRTQAQAIQQPNTTPRPRPTPHPRPTPRTTPTPTPTASPTPTPVGQVEVTKYYIYDGERPILEYDPTLPDAAWMNYYGKGVDEILRRFDPTGPSPQPVFYQQDHEGSVTYLTYDAPPGQTPILEYYRYDVFGQPAIYGPDNQVRQASLYSNRFLFTGREYNANFGFYEYRVRAYHPSLGRFMSEDPKLFVRRAALAKAGGDWSFAAHPDEAELNLFRYCGNDPVDNVDPMGLASEQTGLLTSGTVDRVWEMTKWFDRSNLVQGNFEGFDTMSGLLLNQTDKDAKGGLDTRHGSTIQGTNGNLSIPNATYRTGIEAARAGVDTAYELAKKTKDREMIGPIGQVNGFNAGHFFPGPFYAGIGKILTGKYAGDQGSRIDLLAANLPRGSHLVGYYTVHIHYDPSRIQHVDAPRFQNYWGMAARILMKSPGYNGNWEQPRYYSFPPEW
jgi:RHS repeat-associated protein